MRLDFVFGLPADDHGNTGILVFVCRLSKMVHLAPVPDTITGEQTARLFVDGVFRHHGLPETFVSDRDPRFTAAFWQTLFQLLGTRLHMSTADHPQTDGQAERVNRVLCAVSVRQPLARGQSDSPWLSSHSTTRSTRRPGSPRST
ncbi:hypothetical protein PC119_g26705 [Phytophthora cactorum]|nr:hypothetical protein PC119_g26705 [Phytophthora cactorum]KAG3046999.1 hypothetical protein PC122_g24216 [Phytophthora cactorum]KAG3131177.1 hypothetical protein PC128_g26641 [Phytophthora cactorum]